MSRDLIRPCSFYREYPFQYKMTSLLCQHEPDMAESLREFIFDIVPRYNPVQKILATPRSSHGLVRSRKPNTLTGHPRSRGLLIAGGHALVWMAASLDIMLSWICKGSHTTKCRKFESFQQYLPALPKRTGLNMCINVMLGSRKFRQGWASNNVS